MNAIISELFTTGLTVVAVVSDMGPGNMSLWSKLKIAYNKHVYFSHPSDSNLNIYVLADVPHLIKLLRNHLLDHGLSVNWKTIDKTCFDVLLDCLI